jgi:hypothetical protein
MVPLTGFARTLVNNRQNLDDTMTDLGTSESQKNRVDSSLDAVSQSLIYKMLGYGNMDLTVMGKVSTVTVNGTSVSFDSLVNSTYDIAKPLLSSGAITYDSGAKTVTVNFAKLLSVTTVDSLIGKILENKTAIAMIPPLIDVAVSSLSNGTYAIDQLDFTNVRWDSELSIIQSIYDEIGAKVTGTMISENGSFNAQNFSLDVTSMNDDDFSAQLAKYSDALEKLGSLESVKKNMATLLSGAGVFLKNTGFEILSTDKKAYESIDWSTDLPILGSCALRFFRTIGSDISASLSTTVLSEKTTAALKDSTKRNTIEEIICGTSSPKTYGLLDTGLFRLGSDAETSLTPLNLSRVITTSLSSVPALKKYATGIDFTEAVAGLSQSEFKKEFQTMFSLLSIIYGPDNKIDFDHLGSLDLKDQAIDDEIISILDASEGSAVFKKLYPSVLRSFLFNSDLKLNNYLFGLTPYDFNYSAEDFTEQFKTLLTLMPGIMKMSETFSDSTLTAAEKIDAIDTDTLRKILKVLTSDFFNPSQKVYSASTQYQNANIQVFLTNLFNEEPFTTVGITCPDLAAMDAIDWGDGTEGDGGEIDKLCTIFEKLKKNTVYFLSDKSSLDDISSVDDLTSMAKTGFDSVILEPSIVKIIDDSLNAYLSSLGIPLSLNEMRTDLWKDDMDEFGALVKLLQGLDLTSINFTQLDPTRLNAILTAMSETNFITTGSTAEDPFGYAIYSFLVNQGFFSSLGTKDLGSGAFILSSDDSWSKTRTSTYITLSSGQIGTFDVTTEGEIANLVGLDKALKKAGFGTLKSGVFPSSFVDDVIPYLSSPVVKRILSDVASTTVTKVSLGEDYSAVLQSIDFSLLNSMSKDEIATELRLFALLSDLNSHEEAKLISGKTHLETMLSDFYSIDANGLKDEFTALLTALSGSKLMTETKLGYSLCPLGELFSAAIGKQGLTAKVTLTSGDDASLSSAVLRGILAGITPSEWQDETLSFLTITEDLQGLSSDSLSLLGDLSEEKVTSLVTEMNASRIFHRVPIASLKSDLESRNIASLLVNPTTGKVNHPFDFYVHLTGSEEDVAYWKNDFDLVITLFYGDSDYEGLNKALSGGKTFKDLKFSELSTVALYYIGNMHLFHENRAYFTYNVMKSTMSNEYSPSKILLASANAPYGEDSHVWRLEEIFFSDSKLLAADGTLDKEKAVSDLAMLQKVFGLLLENAKALAADVSDFSSIDMGKTFAEINAAATALSDAAVLYRSDFTSEIVAGVETVFIHNANPKIAAVFSSLSDLDFYADSYALVNPVEGRAFDGIIALAKLTEKLSTDKVYLTKEEILTSTAMTLFGSESESTDALYVYFRNLSYASVHGNSTVGLREKDNILKTPLKDNSSSSPFTKLGDLLTERSLATPDSASYEAVFAAVYALSDIA